MFSASRSLLPARQYLTLLVNGISVRPVSRLHRPAWSKDPHFSGFHTFMEIPVAWGEQDPYGHVNNVAYLRYFESSRMDLLLQLLGPKLTADRYKAFVEAKEVGPILAKASCTYKAPVVYPDTMLVGARVANMQKDRMDMLYRIVSKKTGRIVAEGDSLIVTYDYRIFKKAPIPAEVEKIFRETMEAAGPVA